MRQAITAVTNQRHEDALAGVRELVILGIEAELNSLGAGESDEQKRQRRDVLFDFELDSTMNVAAKLDAETLEYIATQVTNFETKYGWIHRFLPQVSKWRSVTGDRTEVAVRDYVFLRDRDLTANSVHVFKEIHEALDISEGIHILTGDSLRNACAVLDISIHSREIDAAIRKAQIEPEPYAEIYEIRNLNWAATDEAWAASHLTRETAETLLDNPDHAERLKHYMDEHNSPLHSVAMDHFADYMKTQPSISNGVL